MSKNLSRDVQTLLRIKKYMDKIKSTLKNHKCSNLDTFIKDEECMDLCAFSVLQINELSKQLTQDTYSNIHFISTSNLIPVRNMIAHDYINMQYAVLYAFITQACSSNSYVDIRDRLKYCMDNKKKN